MYYELGAVAAFEKLGVSNAWITKMIQGARGPTPYLFKRMWDSLATHTIPTAGKPTGVSPHLMKRDVAQDVLRNRLSEPRFNTYGRTPEGDRVAHRALSTLSDGIRERDAKVREALHKRFNAKLEF